MKLSSSALHKQSVSPLEALCQARPWVRSLMLATLFGALTALSAQLSIRIPWSPVPLTGQVLMVLLAGGMLGARLGAVSQLEYLALGLMGLPVFAGGTSGPLAFAGPTGGYLIGFVAAAWVVGGIIQHQARSWRILLATLCGVAVIHLFGGLWLFVWLRIYQPAAASFVQTLILGFFPFVWADLGKALVATQAIYQSVKRTS